MGVAERIKMIIEMNQMNASSFALRMEVQRSSLSHILNNRNKPSFDFLERILIHFPKVSAHWLITGEGSLIELEPKNLKASEIEPIKEIKTNTLDKKTIKTIVFYEDFTFDVFLPNLK